MKLHYTEYGEGPIRLMILHGLMGSERNWTGIAKALGASMRVIVPDLRNHGQSPHADEHTVASMRQDVLELADQLTDAPLFFLGHSMGGYVAMDIACRHPERLHGLIVEDIAPRSYATGLTGILNAMAALDLANLRSKSEVDSRLSAAVPRGEVRKFLLTNLQTVNGHLSWRINIPALIRFTKEDLIQNMFTPDLRYAGPSLFIGGGSSPYLLTDDEPLIRRHFPNAEISIIQNADHWVHYDAPDSFMRLILKFVTGHQPVTNSR